MPASSYSNNTFFDAVIMMIDDEPLVMDVLETSLEEYGYQFFVKVEDSRQAVTAITEHKPDVVLLDLKMPHVDGFDILQEIRSNPETRFLSVIVLTSSNNSKTKLEALEMGATDFLAKPIDPSELLLRIKNTLTVKAYQDQLAFYDTLTNLPNRRLFVDRLEWAINHATREKNQVAILNIAIDRFQQVNDLLGPQAGDQLLVETGQRLLKSLRETDTVTRGHATARWRNLARLSGDEFSILLTDIPNADALIPIAERMQDALKNPFKLHGREIFVTASIGIATFPVDADSTDSLMIKASAATAYAKKIGRNCYQFYSAELNAVTQRRVSLEQDLRRVLENNELSIVYQPKVCLSDDTVVGVEALLRWNSPTHGSVSPVEFIPIAEECGMIEEIGNWVLEHSLLEAQDWANKGLPLTLSVNVSAYQFCDNNFPNILQKALRQSSFNPERLIIEITEGVLIGDKERIGDLLFKVKMTGAQLSVDDFGTGYSSLSYLKSFPIDELKIDRSFIIDLPTDTETTAIVRAIVAMAKSLDLTIVAEGVEEPQQLDFLRRIECDTVQGYIFAKPMPPEELWLFCKKSTDKTAPKAKP